VLRAAQTHAWGTVLDDECWASGALGMAVAEAKLGDRDPEGALARDIASRAAARPTPGTRALLEALRRVAPETSHAALDSAIAELAELTAPDWVGTTWRIRAAATAADAWDDNRLHFIAYDAPVPHTVIVGEQRCLGHWVDLVLVSDRDAIAEWGPEIYGDTPLELRDRPVADVMLDIARAMQRTDMTWPPQDDETYRDNAALVRSRVADGFRALEDEPEWELISDQDRQQLIADFLASVGLENSDDDAVLVADCFVDYGDAYLAGGDPLAWSPDVPELFLDWMQRKVMLDMSARARVPDLLLAWVRFALSRRGLPEESIEPVVLCAREAVEDTLDDDWGVAEEIGAQLIAQGIDLSDPDAVQAGMQAVNARRLAMAVAAGTHSLPPDDLALIRVWVDAQVPAEAADQVRWDVDLDRDRVTVVELRAPWDGEGDWTRREIAQLRHADDVWSLYWHRLGGRWDPYPHHAPSRDVRTALAAIDDNVTGCFE
jgi:hypothetical protein